LRKNPSEILFHLRAKIKRKIVWRVGQTEMEDVEESFHLPACFFHPAKSEN
jgi:hypothetical protein